MILARVIVVGSVLGGAAVRAEPMGETGQIIVSGGVYASYETTSAPPGSVAPKPLKSIGLSPGLQYFVAPDLSLGGVLLYTHGWSAGGYDGYGIGPQGGYVVHLAPQLSWYPSATLFYVRSSSDSASGMTASGSAVTFTLFAPVLFHPANHVFIGFGPEFRTELSSSLSIDGVSQSVGKVTSIAAQSTIGVYF